MRFLPRLAAPLVIVGLAVLGAVLRFGQWGRVWYLLLACAFTVWLAWMQRGRWRDASMSCAVVILLLAVIEAGGIVSMARPYDSNTPGYSVSHPVLGWSLGRAGTYHQVKRYSEQGGLIFAVDYTVAPDGQRRVASAPDGPTVAFFGDSMTLGTGVSDAETLPQLFADATQRRLRVLNLAMSGYGPQQFLRALETDLHGADLRQAKLLVMKTSAWHAERSSCWASFMLRAPRYILEAGVPRHAGRCLDDWWIALRGQFTASATYHAFVAPGLPGPSEADIDLYIAILVRAGVLAREKYHAATAILYEPTNTGYLDRSGLDDAAIMRRLRAGGLIVLDGTLRAADFPGQPLEIPGDGHPTGTANRAHAGLLWRGAQAGWLPE